MKLAKNKTDRTFGVEIEFTTNGSRTQSEVAARVNSAFRSIDIVSEGWNHDTRNHWKIVTDSSCGFELVSPILSGSDGLKEAQKVINALSNVDGVMVNRSCGIHVHVGCNDITKTGMINTLVHYAKNELLIESVLAPSRRATSRWANSLLDARMGSALSIRNGEPHGSIDEFKAWLETFETCNDIVHAFQNRYGNMDRYRTVNVQAWNRQRTIEFRQHGGSLDSTKILTWVLFLLNTVEKCMATDKLVSCNIKQDPKKAFKQLFGESKVVYDYMLKRAIHFGYDCYGTPNVVEVKRTWVDDTNKWKVVEMTNGTFNVQQNLSSNNRHNADTWVDVNSNRKILNMLTGNTEVKTTRQLGTMLFNAITHNDSECEQGVCNACEQGN